MLEFFNRVIKPKNDQLGRDLGITPIEVKHVATTQAVPVMLKYRNRYGKRVQVKNTEVQFMRAIGLEV